MAGMTPAELGEAVSECLAATGGLLSDLVGSQGSRERDTALPSLFRRSAELQQRLQEEDCTVAVLAAIKSGKSTLLNALLGDAVLPSNNVPETARIVRLQHAPARDSPRLSFSLPGGGIARVESAPLVREHLRQLNAAARDASAGSPASSRGGTAPAEEAPLVIEACVAALAAGPATAEGQLHPRLALLDTPGPNEAGQAQLRYKVERLLGGVDAVLYLLDYTKLKSSDEAAMLQRLHELNPQLIRRISRRIFFVVNKMDVAETCEGMGAEETRAYVAALITEQLGLPGFELLPEQVFTISAREALLSRLVLGGRAEGDELDHFRKAAFGRCWRAVTDPQLIRETAEEMLAGSGLPELETGVMSFLGGRAAVLHLVALLDDHERLLAQVHNLTRASAASLRRGVAELQAQAQALRGRLAATLGAFEGVRGEVDELEGLVVDEVRERMGRLRSRLEGHIGEALSPDRPPVAAPRGRWPAVWAKAKGLLGLGGGDAGGADAQERLQMDLCELHSLIYQQVEAEVRDFWGSLEQSTNARQRQLFSAINARIAELSAAVEAEVSLTLCCQLEPVDMRLRTPSAEDFHCSLQELLERGIQRQVTVEEQEATTAVPVFVKRARGPGLCSPAQEWWEPLVEERTGPVRVERVTFSADLEAIRRYFVGIIDSTTQNSVRAVRHYVRAYLAERLEEARRVLQAYADQYTAAMMDSLEVARQGEAERCAALGVAETHSATAATLLDRVWELQRRAEEMLEGWGLELEQEEEGKGEEVCGKESGAATTARSQDSSSSSLLQQLCREEVPASADDSQGPAGGVEEGPLEEERTPAVAGASAVNRGASGSGDEEPPSLASSCFPEDSAAVAQLGGSQPMLSDFGLLDGFFERASSTAEPGVPGIAAAWQPRRQEGGGDEDEAPAHFDADSVCSADDSVASAPGLVAESMCSADSGSAPPPLADSMLDYAPCDELPPLLGDSTHNIAGTACPAGDALEPAGSAGCARNNSINARSSSRAAEAAAAYQAAEAACLAAALLPTRDGECSTAEVPLHDVCGSVEASPEAAEGSTVGSSSSDEDWTVVSAASGDVQEGQPDGEEALVGSEPAKPASA